MEFISEYGLFLLKTITLVGALVVVIGLIASASMRNRQDSDGDLVVKRLNDDIDEYRESIEDAILSKEELKAQHKQRQKEDKAKAKEEKKRLKSDEPAEETKKRFFVLDFNGDVKASEVDLLRHEITAVLTEATQDDEIILRLESPGGMVHTYGLAASQLQRIRDKGIPLTVCVDEVAASGGYMMACLGNKIIAAPFALIGSIGVLAQVPNFHRLLKKHDIDYELFTAGEYKRTVTTLGENTEKGREKFQNDLEETHALFRNHVATFRPELDVEAVATGEVWYGQQALDNKLIDAVGTSDDYIVKACAEADVYSIRFEYKKTLQEKLGVAVQLAIEKAATTVLSRIQHSNISKS